MKLKQKVKPELLWRAAVSAAPYDTIPWENIPPVLPGVTIETSLKAWDKTWASFFAKLEQAKISQKMHRNCEL